MLLLAESLRLTDEELQLGPEAPAQILQSPQPLLTETYAKQFAAELLMPADGVRKMVGGESELESHRTIQRLAWYFQVSFQAIAIAIAIAIRVHAFP